MGNIIPVVDKKEFLKTFLQQFELKRRECAWLLNYLMSDDELMERVHFVEQAAHTPKALIISAKGVDSIPFSFHKEKHITTDAEKAFHDIRLNQTEDIYIELHFTGARQYPPYLVVLEDNPHIPENLELAVAFQQETEWLLDRSLKSFKKERLIKEIDQALDEQDECRFHQLVWELKQIDEN
ncbi:ReoY family proteolytic degradation factor [Alkalihalobacillus sp. MEB130]|uniref:ReoY family proteolytic degradation factor n=1 Tax=Alkalihalobacillus sp. MEB130 TaxID=2976704 RepID=UPI0028DF00AA|nr:ReoY family proteolytic degradation factor [Alkalihalobacillus sp. MEB130]MDT8859998.1 ReoY family proteolytic degradation factor [Alkalihalobacillus sp. MEB130]